MLALQLSDCREERPTGGASPEGRRYAFDGTPQEVHVKVSAASWHNRGLQFGGAPDSQNKHDDS